MAAILGAQGLAQGSAQAAGPSCGGADGLPPGARAGVYSGTLGGLPVVLQLGGGSQYYYASRARDISLDQGHSGAALVMQEQGWNAKTSDFVSTACFRLTPAGTTLRGTWTPLKAGGKPLNVSLTRVDASTLALKLPATPGLLKLRRDDPYNFLRLNHPWVGVQGGRAVREPASGVTYPRVPGASAALNAALQDRQLAYAADALGCLSSGRTDVDVSYDLSAGSLFLTPKLLSVMDTVDLYCGGAHPDAYQSGAILDRLTGQPVALTDLWYGLDDAEQKRRYLAAYPKDADAECKKVVQEGSSAFTASLTRSGVQLVPNDLPHVAQACAEAVTLPYASLRDLLNTSSPYANEFPR